MDTSWSFNLFGFDIIKADNAYGCWLISFKNWDSEVERSLLSINYYQGAWMIDVCFFKLIG